MKKNYQLADYRKNTTKPRLAQINQYTESVISFAFFCQHCIIPQSQKSQNFPYIAKQLQKALSKFGVKAIRSVKYLCLKLLQNNFINIIHTIYLQALLKKSLEKQALPLIDMRCYPSIQFKQYHQYLYYAFQINFKLRRYRQAHDNLKTAFEQNAIYVLNLSQRRIILNLIKYYILLKVFLGLKEFSQENWKEMCTQFAIYHDSHSNIEDKLQNYQMIQAYYSTKGFGKCIKFIITNDYTINSDVENFLINYDKNDHICRFMFVYFKKNRETGLQFISYHIERIKSEELGKMSLRNVQIMIRLNFPSLIGKYDCRNGIFYFDYSVDYWGDSCVLISQCYNMYRALKLVQKMQERRKRERSSMQIKKEGMHPGMKMLMKNGMDFPFGAIKFG